MLIVFVFFCMRVCLTRKHLTFGSSRTTTRTHCYILCNTHRIKWFCIWFSRLTGFPTLTLNHTAVTCYFGFPQDLLISGYRYMYLINVSIRNMTLSIISGKQIYAAKINSVYNSKIHMLYDFLEVEWLLE